MTKITLAEVACLLISKQVLLSEFWVNALDGKKCGLSRSRPNFDKFNCVMPADLYLCDGINMTRCKNIFNWAYTKFAIKSYNGTY